MKRVMLTLQDNDIHISVLHELVQHGMIRSTKYWLRSNIITVCTRYSLQTGVPRFVIAEHESILYHFAWASSRINPRIMRA